MAVSQNTQRGFYGDHADECSYWPTIEKAEAMKSAMRASGLYRKVSHSRINDGSARQPRWAFKVMGWRAPVAPSRPTAERDNVTP